MNNWNEIRTAACVARTGTVSAAAQELDIHRATVNRHIEVLETELGAKLFLRSAKGYTPTELGRTLLRIADETEATFSELRRSAKVGSGDLSGTLTISIIEILVPDILPALRLYADQNPHVSIRLKTGPALARLEQGEADIAFRVGKRPSDPDNVVVPFNDITLGLFASKDYVRRRGKPNGIGDFNQHDFISASEPQHLGTPFLRWLSQNVPAEHIRLRCNEMPDMERAVTSGFGIGFVPHKLVGDRTDLVEVLPSRRHWTIKSWRVTHLDLHRSEKVQALLQILKQAR